MKKISLALTLLLSFNLLQAQENTELDQNSLEFSESTTLKSTISWDGVNGDLIIENKQPTIPGTIEGDIFIKSTDDIFINGGAPGISMGIYQNGHVGIGEASTAQPEALLTLKQKSATPNSNSGLRIKNLSGADSGRMWIDGSGNFVIQKGGNTNQLSLDASGNVGIGTGALGNIKLNVDGRMRINGNTDGTAWVFGLTGSSIFRGASKFVHNLAAPGDDPKIEGFKIENEGANGHYVTIYVYDDNGEIGLFTDQGNGFQGKIGGFSATSGVYNSVSDARIKKDIENIPNIQNKIAALRPVHYVFKNDADGTQTTGFLAQELIKLFPEFVSYNAKQDLYAVNYAGLSTIAIKGIQELQQENKTLTERIEKLEKQMNQLKK